jgi:amino-acid N-acetyltransferase
MSEIFSPSINDIPKIYALLKPYVAQGLILERTLNDIKKSINTFLVYGDGKSITGVISYYNYGPFLKEIRSLAVESDSTHRGIGSRLVQEMINHIDPEIKTKIFVLTYSPIFFEHNGFLPINKESLPEKIWKDCSKCSNRENCGESALIFTS